MKKLIFKDLIVFEDDNFIAINKPYDVSTLEDRDKTRQNILKLAKTYADDAQVCHRLDRETSGILMIAKNPEAYRHMSMQFENREVTKIYHAVIEGTKKLDNQMVDLPISILKDGSVRIDKMEGKESATIFNTLQAYHRYSLVACLPITGRMHQIRIHLSTIGHPIVADDLYGGKPIFLSSLKRNFKLKKDTEELPLMKRVALHAKSLTFNDLANKETTVTAEYPKDFAVLIRQLVENT
ncbi:MAG: RluA family pseudouridine synthase [Cytophagales bacterium]